MELVCDVITLKMNATSSSSFPRGRNRCDLFALLRSEYQVRPIYSYAYLLFTTECGLRPIPFYQFLGQEALEVFRTANRRILDKLDGVRFLFIVQVIEKVQKKAQFSCCGQRKAFHYEIVLLGIQLFFLHGGALGLSVLKCNQGSDVLGNFEVFTPWSRKLLN